MAQVVANDIVYKAIREEMDELAMLHPDFNNKESGYYQDTSACLADIIINNEKFRHYESPSIEITPNMSIDGFSFTPGGKETAQSWQMSNPSMWREGTPMYAVAKERKQRKSRYVNSDGTATYLSRKKIEEDREAMMRFYAAKKVTMRKVGDIGFDIATDIGLSTGLIAFAELALGGQNLIASFAIGLVVGIIISFLLMNLCEGMTGTDESLVLPEIIIT